MNNGKYNVFMVDWSKLSMIPCYAAAVHNLKPVAKCMAVMLTHLRAAGLDMDQLTCVGHSLGAHLCGIMANYLPFRMHRIIGTYIYLYEKSEITSGKVQKKKTNFQIQNTIIGKYKIHHHNIVH